MKLIKTEQEYNEALNS